MDILTEKTTKPFESGKPLHEMQAGDWVILDKRRNGSEFYQIKRVTNTQIIISANNMANQPYDRKFYREQSWKQGKEVGNMDSYYPSRIKPYTNEDYTDIIQHKKYEKVSDKIPALNDKSNNSELINKAYDFLLSINLITPVSE